MLESSKNCTNFASSWPEEQPLDGAVKTDKVMQLKSSFFISNFVTYSSVQQFKPYLALFVYNICILKWLPLFTVWRTKKN